MTSTPFAAHGTDVLRWPIVGSFLKWRHSRTTVQLLLLSIAVVIVLHGLTGPDFAPANLATVVTWVHYRGLLVIALLAAGNIFCAGCPFVLARDWARRLHAPTRLWPRRLRGKWAAVILFAGILVAYELFDLWALPQATALLVIGYFAAALAVDTAFKGATFCKHLCPIGQFNFIASTVSPLEIQVREIATCRTCQTSDCIAGRRAAPASPHIVQRGCELGLFLPTKVGNLDCTFCLDCVHACPHDNVALATRAPGIELVDDRRRSGIGRLVNRPDIALLAVVFTFGALLNAFAMTAPAHAVGRWLSIVTGISSEAVTVAVLFAAGLVVAPLILLGGASLLTGMLTGTASASPVRVAVRYAYGLVPLGFGVWLAHYGFHLLTGVLTIVPVTQSAAADMLGTNAFGEPLWRWAGMRPGSVFPIQLGCVLLGAAGAVATTFLIARDAHPRRSAAAVAPWVVVIALLAAAALWVLFQPMEMRGIGAAG
jgi:polyferredoxin